MGLFRRGTKLLRLGGGLRDCCCRPEKPEECWCPDWCRYYWEWGGGLRIAPAIFGASEPCQIFDSVQSYADPPPATYGIGDSSIGTGFFLPAGGSSVVFYKFGGPRVGYTSILYFPFSQETAVAMGFPQECMGPDTYVQYYTDFLVWFRCEYFSGVPVLQIFASLRQAVQAVIGQYLVSTCGITLLNSQKNVTITLPSEYSSCETDPRLRCDPQIFRELQLNRDISIGVGADGVKIDGTLYLWGTDTTERNDAVDWEVEGEYPLSSEAYELTLRRLDSCQPGDPCDCTASLTNRTVLFEGKEMTYGQQDNFFFPANPGDPYSGTWWEETPIGTFTRRDVENCDGSLNQRVKVVEVDCINEGGVDKWVAYLDHTCNERDDLTCPGPADAQRVKQWTGFFLCDENGSPTGSPTALEVDYDVTSGTPAAECVDALQPPSFEFL